MVINFPPESPPRRTIAPVGGLGISPPNSTQSPDMGGSVESVLFMDMYKRHHVGQTLLQLFLLPVNSIHTLDLRAFWPFFTFPKEVFYY